MKNLKYFYLLHCELQKKLLSIYFTNYDVYQCIVDHIILLNSTFFTSSKNKMERFKMSSKFNFKIMLKLKQAFHLTSIFFLVKHVLIKFELLFNNITIYNDI